MHWLLNLKLKTRNYLNQNSFSCFKQRVIPLLGIILSFCWLDPPTGFSQSSYNPRLYTPQRLAQSSLKLQRAKQERFWLGSGEATANYIEQDFPLDQDFTGISWEYTEQLYHGRDGSGGWLTSWSLLDTRFELNAADTFGNQHQLQTHLLAGVWGLGLTRQLKMSNDYLLMFGADIYLGIGLIQFSKKLNYSYGRVENFSEKYGFDVVTGWDSFILLEYDESWLFGWKRSFYRNKVTIDYDDFQAYLTHISSTIFFIGRRFGQVSCVPTAYVSCD